MTAHQEEKEEAFVNAGRGEQPALWGVQHGEVCLSYCDDVERAADEVDAADGCGWCGMAHDYGCVVVVSRDGGLTWQPA